MDVGAFVQENKRWLIGCAIGAVAWLVGSTVIGSVWNENAAAPSPRKLGAPDREVYDQTALQAARQEEEQLAAAAAAQREALAFVQQDKYLLAGKGKADEYLYQVGRALKQAILTAADERDAQVSETSIVWDVPTGVDDVKNTLFGLELLDELQQRLFAAHDAVKKANPDAPGLRALQSLKVDARRGGRSPVRTLRPGEIDPRDAFTQEQVSFQFQASEAVVLGFLEACSKPQRTLVVDSWQLVKPARPGEPATVKGTVLGLAFKETK